MTYLSEVLADSPLAVWLMDDAAGSGTVLDYSGNNRHLSVVGAPTLDAAPIMPYGSGSIDFPNNVANRLSLASAAWMQVPSYSVTAWINNDSIAVSGIYQCIWSRDGNSSNRGPSFYVKGNKLNLVVSGDSLSTTALSAGTDYFVGFSYDNPTTTLTYYVNGVAAGSFTVSKPNNLANDITVAASRAGSPSAQNFPWDGRSGPIAYFGTALSGARHAAHYAAGIAPPPPPPPPPPPLDDGTAHITRITHRITGGKWLTTFGFTTNGGVAQPQITPSPTPSGGKTLSQLLRPVGEVTMWYGATADIPAGWLRCDGAAFSGTDYPELATLLGGTNTPNLVDRFPVGAGTKALGTSGGDPTKVIAEANLPGHKHGMPRSAVTGSGAAVPRGGAVDGTTTQTDNGAGTSTPLDVMNPWRALHFIIRGR